VGGPFLFGNARALKVLVLPKLIAHRIPSAVGTFAFCGGAVVIFGATRNWSEFGAAKVLREELFNEC